MWRDAQAEQTAGSATNPERARHQARSGVDKPADPTANRLVSQCRCGPPPQQPPHELGFMPQAGAALGLAATEEANTDSFFDSLVDPQCGHFAPCHLLERTRSSLSCSHFSQ